MIVFGTDGVEAVTLLRDDSAFSPMVGESNDVLVSPLWRLMPSEFSLLPRRDRLVMESVWSGMLKAFASEMADAAFLDMTQSLLQFPVFRQRKWLRVDVLRGYDTTGIPADVQTSGSVAA